jgi:hypothetical protein
MSDRGFGLLRYGFDFSQKKGGSAMQNILAGLVSVAIICAALWVGSGLDKIANAISGKTPKDVSAAAAASPGSTSASTWDKFVKVADGFDSQSKALADKAKQSSDLAKSLREGITELQRKLAPLKKAAADLP